MPCTLFMKEKLDKCNILDYCIDIIIQQARKRDMNGVQVLEQPAQKKGISGSTIKIMAIISMLIDHIGAGILGKLIVNPDCIQIVMSGDRNNIIRWLISNGMLYSVYITMRRVGRLAFPIFCFMLVEGFQRTHDVKKYALRLGLFALISEIPFDLCFNGAILEFNYQNVFFTLLLGLLTMIAFDRIDKKEWVAEDMLNNVVKMFLSAAALVAGAGIAHVMKTDYAAKGVLCIMVMYVFRKIKSLQITAGCVAFLWEEVAPFAFIPIVFYNGKRGLKIKYFFYVFYPVHLLLIWLMSMLIGMDWNLSLT